MRKNLHDRILRGESKEQHLSIVHLYLSLTLYKYHPRTLRSVTILVIIFKIYLYSAYFTEN